MEKFKYDALAVELSRRCNLKCIHCGRGDAQDVTITQEIIDAIIENVDQCPQWELLGGEPLLAMDMLEYLIERLIHSDVGAKHFSLTTNGTILDPDLIPLLARFSESGDDRSAYIRISDDPFHNVEQSKMAHDFYSEQASRYKNIKVGFVFREEFKEIQKREYFLNYQMPFQIAGRAWDNVEAVAKLSEYGIQPAQTKNHRIRIDEKTAKCLLAIWANGNVGFAEMQDYNTMDRLAIGNILDSSMYDMITKHNADCLLSCWDLQQWEKMSAWRIPGYLEQEYPMMPFLNELISRIAENVFEKILAARETAHKKYPSIPAWRIIEAIPFPDFNTNGEAVIREILAQFPSSGLFDDSLTDTGLLERACIAIKDMRNDSEKDRVYNGLDSLMDALKCYGKLDKIKISQSLIDTLAEYEKTGAEAEEKNSACQETNSGAFESGDMKEVIKHYVKAAREHKYTKVGYEFSKTIQDFMERG